MTMPHNEVAIERAGVEHAALLGNLLELYIHDMSAFFSHVKLGDDGRYGYPELNSYLTRGDDRRAFLFRCDRAVAGFALVRRGSPASDDPNVLDVAEFFVLRQFRARGIGRAAAALIWQCVPGSWTIRASQRNAAAVSFWRGAVSQFAGERAKEFDRASGLSSWTVFSFDNSDRHCP